MSKETSSNDDEFVSLSGLNTQNDKNLKNLESKIKFLEDKLSSEKDNRKEERFCWFLVAIILFNCCIFTALNNWGSSIAILVLDIVLLTILAKHCGVEEVKGLIDKFITYKSKN